MLLAAGALDPTFGTGGLGRAGLTRPEAAVGTDVVVVQGDGKILVAGNLSPSYTGQIVARFNGDGTLDTTFAGGGGIVPIGFSGTSSGSPQLALQPDGRILVACNDGSYAVGLARLNADGSFDTTFGEAGTGRVSTAVGGTPEVWTVELQPEGKVLVGGERFASGRLSDFLLTRFTADGRLDPTFDGDGIVTTAFADEAAIEGLAVLPDGDILAAGRANYIEAGSFQRRAAFGVARYNADGSLDTAFGTGGKVGGGPGAALLAAGDVWLVGDGKFVVGGITAGAFAVARFNGDGTLDTSFGGGDGVGAGPTLTGIGSPYALDLAVAPDGALLVSGYVTDSSALLAKFSASGDIDTSFGNGGYVRGESLHSSFSAVDVTPGGRILTTGYRGIGDLAVLAYTPAGRADAAFGVGGVASTRVPAGTDDRAQDMLVQPDGRTVVVGAALRADGGSSYVGGGIVRFNPDGSLDPHFGTGGIATLDYGTDQEVWYAVDRLPDGKLLLGGTYTDPNLLTPRRLFARLDPNGTVDTSFGTGGFSLGTAGIAIDVAAIPWGGFLAAGVTRDWFSSDPWIERYEPGGSRDASFPTITAATTVGRVNRLHVLGDGRFYAVVGTIAEGVSPPPAQPLGPKLFRFNADGTADASFGNGGRADAGPHATVGAPRLNALVIDTAGRVIVGGTTGVDAAVYRFTPDGRLDTTFGGGTGAVIEQLGEGVGDGWNAIALEPDGQIVAAGYVQRPSPVFSYDSDQLLTRLNDDGTRDPWFGDQGFAAFDFGAGSRPATNTLVGVHVLGDGRILAGGSAVMSPQVPIHRRSDDFVLIRLQADGVKADAGGPYNGSEGSGMALSATGTTLPGRSLTRWEWDFDYDGVTFDSDAEGRSVSMPASLLPDGPATKRVAVRVTDSAGDSHVDDAVIHVRNVEPQTTVGGNATWPAGSPYTISIGASDPGRDTLGWRIDWGDGVVETLPNNPVSATHTYADGRNLYNIVATPSDEDGTYPAKTVTVVIEGPNDPPVITELATVASRIHEGYFGFSLGARFSDADTADPHTVTIDWGDRTAPTVLEFPPASSAVQVYASHDYRDDDPPGTPEDTYTITVTVTDGRESAVQTRTVTVFNTPPTARAGSDRAVAEGTTVTLTGSFSDNVSDDGHTYRWTVRTDNGDVIPETTQPVLTFTPTDQGTYVARLTVTDDDGGSHTDEAVVRVTDVTPTFSVTVPPTAERGRPYTVTLGATDPGRDPVAGWTVDWGDGLVESLPATATSATHTYTAAPLSPRVVVTMTNDDGTFHATPTVGGLDGSFGTGGIVAVVSRTGADVAVQPDGKFVVVRGAVTDERFWSVRRYNPDGSPDTTFGRNGANDTPPSTSFANSAAVVVMPDGKILVAGASSRPTGSGVFPVLARYNADGSLDTTFGTGGFLYTTFGRPETVSQFWDLALAPDGKVVAAGAIAERPTNSFDTDFFAARFNADGTPDATFGTGGRTTAVDFGRRPNRGSAVLVTADGKVVVGGETDFTGPSGGPPPPSRFGLARFNADGTLDTTFGTGGTVTTAAGSTVSWIRRLAAGPDGTIVAVGSADSLSPAGVNFAVARYRADGSLDSSFDGDGIARVRFSNSDNGMALEVLPDGSVVAAGSADFGRAFGFARLTPTGQLDPSFGNGGTFTTRVSPTAPGFATSVAILPDGRMLAVGFGGMMRFLPGGTPVTVPEPVPRVVARHVFYNHSFFDGGRAAADGGDDAAVAPDKAALLPGQPPTFVNVTSYTRGINGIMIDVVGLADAAERLLFHTAPSPDAAAWQAAPAPLSITRRAGAGVDGSDRITVVWASGAIVNRWLRVTLPPDAAAGLASADVSYWGNLVGETGVGGPTPVVNALDVSATRAASTSTGRRVGLASRFDFNRDGRANAVDWAIVRRAMFSTLPVAAAPASAAPSRRIAEQVLPS